MTDPRAILRRVVTIIGDNPDYRPRVPVAQITLATRFRDDLGFDSLAMMALAYELQESYPDLDEMAIASWTTVEDCVNHLRSLAR
jgi:acyl carrier protein